MYRLSPAGQLVWKAKLDGDIFATPALRPDGTLVVATADGLTLARGIEDVELSHYGPLGVVEHVTDYSIQGDRLEDDHWSAFELGDRDILLFALAGGLPPITAYPDDGTRAKVQEMWSRMDLMPQAAPTARARA